MKISRGELCALVGPVGAGKSSLLNLLLKELPLGVGSIRMLQYNEDDSKSDETVSSRRYVTDNPDFSISYASQDPWLFVATVRENILFGQPYNKTRYQEVTKVCSLIRDFKQFPEGDMTIVGERGTALSGGQRARINLARAIYRQADLYLLDDPLSAVDSRVSRQLFKKCILDYLKGKTRILVTHQLQFLKEVDTIVMLDRVRYLFTIYYSYCGIPFEKEVSSFFLMLCYSTVFGMLNNGARQFRKIFNNFIIF